MEKNYHKFLIYGKMVIINFADMKISLTDNLNLWENAYCRVSVQFFCGQKILKWTKFMISTPSNYKTKITCRITIFTNYENF